MSEVTKNNRHEVSFQNDNGDLITESMKGYKDKRSAVVAAATIVSDKNPEDDTYVVIDVKCGTGTVDTVKYDKTKNLLNEE